MNFDKFRQIDMPDVDVKADLTYIKKLERLPQKRKSIAPVLLSVGAAVLMLAVFGLWALIGGAIRNSGEYVAEPLDQIESETLTLEMTDELKAKLEALYAERLLVILPYFDENNPLTAEQIITFCYDSDSPYFADATLTCEEFSQFAKESFGYNMTIPEDIVYENAAVHRYDYFFPKPTAITIKDGRAEIVYSSTGYEYILGIVCNSVTPLEFGHIFSFNSELVPINQPVEMTDALRETLDNWYFKQKIFTLPDFDGQNPLSSEQVMKYFELTGKIYDEDLVFTRDEFSALAKEIFGYDMTIPEDIVHEVIGISNITIIPTTAESFTVTLYAQRADIVFLSDEGKHTLTVEFKFTGTDEQPVEILKILASKKENIKTAQ